MVFLPGLRQNNHTPHWIEQFFVRWEIIKTMISSTKPIAIKTIIHSVHLSSIKHIVLDEKLTTKPLPLELAYTITQIPIGRSIEMDNKTKDCHILFYSL